MTKFLNISTDNTLGGNSPSDETVSSQKAIKEYIGNNALPKSTKYGADLNYSGNSLQLKDQDGNNLGNAVTIKSSPDIDNKSITNNSSDELQTVGVINQADLSTAVKTWTGTAQEYGLIQNKDASTLYNITDDLPSTTVLLDKIYPIGSLYFGTMATCPMAALIGTWQLVSSGRVIQGADSNHPAGTTANAGIPNITGYFNCSIPAQHGKTVSGAFTGITLGSSSDLGMSGGSAVSYTAASVYGFDFDASRCSSVYGNSNTVQPPAFFVNIWQRIL